ncbi:Integrin alpha-4 [Thelohanellus kitauei]|uniref:Integrin alpha-4 n=1 Tax=Thelohanellus kitauei TaxID=669202 RepID=A0A0C2MFR4_THEKT|nr:Integrin alpha-4 [Thelohanellus kitauei]
MPDTFVFATNDNTDQRGILYFHNLPFKDSLLLPNLTISDPAWQPFTNFGNKIVIVDINNDNFNDLIVTSPTSKWLDLPEVGHVHLFMNTQSEPFFKPKSIIIRGLPIAHSFFGWNAEVVGDLDGDGANDILIAALKVSDGDLRGGVYVYFGGDESVIRDLTYYEIIRPSETVENKLTGFGFFISSKMVLDTEGNNYIMMSRVFNGEVDVQKLTKRAIIKVYVDVEPNQFTIDESKFYVTFDFISSLLAKKELNFLIKIRYTNVINQLNATTKLSFMHSTNYEMVSADYPPNTHVFDHNVTHGSEEQHRVHLLPSYDKLSPKWILQAEIILKSSRTTTTDDPAITLFHQIFYREISFERECPQKECIESYAVESTNDPIWFQNTDQPIEFSIQLTNKGSFLTHLIIDAGLSMDCKISIPDMEVIQNLNSSNFWFASQNSNVRVLYNKSTQSGGSFQFDVLVYCPQVINVAPDPILKLAIKSFLSRDPQKFEIRARTKFKHEFTIETKKSHTLSNKVCPDSETEKNIEFNVELSIKEDHYDNDLRLSATLNLEDTVGLSVISIDIKPLQNKVAQIFQIQKEDRVKQVRLSISCKMMIKSSKDFHITLHVEPVLESNSPYKLKSIMTNEVEQIVMISFEYCKKHLLIMIFAALGCVILIIGAGILVHIKIVVPRLITPNEDLTQFAEHQEPVVTL